MKCYRYSMNMKVLNVLCILFYIPLFFVVYLLGIFNYLNFKLIILYFFWMFFHEFLHGVGFSLSHGVKGRDIVYGACLEKGIFYCMCKGLIGKGDILRSLLFPFFFIGIFTFFIGLFCSSPILILLSLLNISGCVGDLCMFFSFYRLPSFSYVDLDDCTGFVLVSESDLSKFKMFGLNLVQVYDFSDFNFSSNYKKFTVSKLSLFIFILLVVLLLFSLFFA